jgi:hypothetical protein
MSMLPPAALPSPARWCISLHFIDLCPVELEGRSQIEINFELFSGIHNPYTVNGETVS